MVMIEAMSQGCPVISFARGAAPELVADQVSGFLVRNVDEMVERIRHIDAIDRNAVRLHFERNFSARAMTEKYVEVYKRIIQMHSNATPLAPPALGEKSETTALPGMSQAQVPQLPITPPRRTPL